MGGPMGMKTRRTGRSSTLRGAECGLVLLAFVMVIGCVSIVVSWPTNWLPLAIVVVIAAGLFMLVVFQLSRSRGDEQES